MVQAFKLPDLGEGIHEGEIVDVLVSVGDRIEEGQPFLVIETDKATVEIPSPFTGTVQEIRVKPGDLVKVGTVLTVFGNGEILEPSPPRAPSQGEALADQASRSAGPDGESHEDRHPRQGPVPASPATRRLARELSVDLRQVAGSGPAGLVTAEDVRAVAQRGAEPDGAAASSGKAAEQVESPAAGGKQEGPILVGEARDRPADSSSGTIAPDLPDFGRWGPVERVQLRSVRRATAAHMALAWAQVPHVNHQDLADITELESFRRRHTAGIDSLGGKLTLTVFVLKAVVAALRKYPSFNSSLDMQKQEIILKGYYHIGVASDTDRGLLVPVLREVDRKSIAELAVELSQMASRARAGETSLEELQGGTFTVTNIGALGGTGFSPIVNYPQVAILGMGRARPQPVVVGNEEEYEMVPRLLMPLVLAFDHRVVDGADAARFLGMVIKLLEKPDEMWLRV